MVYRSSNVGNEDGRLGYSYSSLLNYIRHGGLKPAVVDLRSSLLARHGIPSVVEFSIIYYSNMVKFLKTRTLCEGNMMCGAQAFKKLNVYHRYHISVVRPLERRKIFLSVNFSVGYSKDVTGISDKRSTSKRLANWALNFIYHATDAHITCSLQ